MKGDFARVTFDRKLHFSRVLQQQGRVLLEADWNEQGAIGLHLLRTLITDLVGACWAAGNGFTIGTENADFPGEWTLSLGHFYVDGILCENETTGWTLADQPHGPIPEGEGAFADLATPSTAFWLDVWERHVTWVEVPGLLDRALNGVDTCSRAEVVWQVRPLDEDAARARTDAIAGALEARANADGTSDSEKASLLSQVAEVNKLADDFAAGGTETDARCQVARDILAARWKYAWPALRAQVGSGKREENACVIAADARYRGVENQLYRVEIHDGGLATDGDGGATFKWSRENGSVIFPIVGAPESADDPNNVVLGTLGRDQRLGLEIGDWVEVVDDETTLAQIVRPLLLVKDVRPDERSVTLQGDLPPLRTHRFLRRWDQRRDVDEHGVVAVTTDEPIELEDNVTVTFEPGRLYEPGDYWLIPARVATGGLEWPEEESTDSASKDHIGVAKPARNGHHAALLGLLVDGDAPFHECCCRQEPLCGASADVVVSEAAVRRARATAPARATKPRRKPPK